MQQIKRPFKCDDDIEEKIAEHFGMTKKMMDEDVETIREWMKTQPHLPEIMDRNSIKHFLIYSKCSVEVAKQKIDLHYCFLTKFPDAFSDFNPKLPHMQKIWDAVYLVPLPKLTKDLSRVVCLKLRDPKFTAREVSYQTFNGHLINFNTIRLEKYMHLTETYIIDTAGYGLDHVKKFVPSQFQKMHVAYEKIYDFPIKVIYIVNTSPFANTIFEFCKALIDSKFFQKVKFLNSEKELLELIPKHILPVDYGGLEKSLDELNEVMRLKFLEHQNRFDVLLRLKVDEKLRPHKLENDVFLGFYGNFKKLDID